MMSAGRSFAEVGQFAAYCCQCRSLRLKPWQTPPMHGDAEPSHPDADDTHGYGAAAELLERLLAAGLSRWEPDPIGALEAAEREPAARMAPTLPATAK
jgi:hypothetical protein